MEYPVKREIHPMPVIGIDIGGSKIRAVLWDGKQVARARELPTPKSKNDFQRRLVALASSLHRHEVEGIGIGAAGIVKGTVLLFSPNIHARAFARAELLRGAGRGARRVFALTIGTGIGRAYGKNGKIIRIKRFEYPEPWEKEYQAVRDRRDNRRLAEFLGKRLAPLMQPYRPEAIVVGGGVLGRRGFLRLLEAAFGSQGVRARLKRARFRKNGAAVGAALLFAG
ncbi:MAG: ROK family protein [Deltaproteobacteria bacterium]|nr:ROK family protein [Deltaproteobacteria bacterium]